MGRLKAHAVMILLALVCLLGCESDGERSSSTPDGTTEASRDVEDTGSYNPLERPALAGVWAQRRYSAAVSEMPVLGNVDTATVSYSLVRITEEPESDLESDSSVCAIEIDNGEAQEAVAVEAPKAFIQALPVATIPATLTREEGGWRFVQPRHYDVRGARLENPETDALPTDASDQRVEDQDGDGDPGMTMWVSSPFGPGRLFIVQRASYALDGYVTGPDRMEGSLDWTDEQVVLGRDPANLPGGGGQKVPRDGESTFLMIRLTEEADCQAVMAAFQ